MTKPYYVFAGEDDSRGMEDFRGKFATQNEAYDFLSTIQAPWKEIFDMEWAQTVFEVGGKPKKSDDITYYIRINGKPIGTVGAENFEMAQKKAKVKYAEQFGDSRIKNVIKIEHTVDFGL